ncbi:hypothetical protein H696_01458 [Fonticula alba]|uniref:phosphoinositide 5-phosphatase n=1 Tax=Fonticula alba TaxID=691883 RepID=A0A058ZCB5_FONAL|nr:hypothetical protein H696_01458 [Fonticula alba]KCV72050.1 hypothetical protein H696_01458 [Fonticula alba]|eukprot:XP_009493628.1 hypothetical protein H696_01458 [Fonticula alba]
MSQWPPPPPMPNQAGPGPGRMPPPPPGRPAAPAPPQPPGNAVAAPAGGAPPTVPRRPAPPPPSAYSQPSRPAAPPPVILAPRPSSSGSSSGGSSSSSSSGSLGAPRPTAPPRPNSALLAAGGTTLAAAPPPPVAPRPGSGILPAGSAPGPGAMRRPLPPPAPSGSTPMRAPPGPGTAGPLLARPVTKEPVLPFRLHISRSTNGARRVRIVPNIQAADPSAQQQQQQQQQPISVESLVFAGGVAARESFSLTPTHTPGLTPDSTPIWGVIGVLPSPTDGEPLLGVVTGAAPAANFPLGFGPPGRADLRAFRITAVAFISLRSSTYDSHLEMSHQRARALAAAAAAAAGGTPGSSAGPPAPGAPGTAPGSEDLHAQAHPLADVLRLFTASGGSFYFAGQGGDLTASYARRERIRRAAPAGANPVVLDSRFLWNEYMLRDIIHLFPLHDLPAPSAHQAPPLLYLIRGFVGTHGVRPPPPLAHSPQPALPEHLPRPALVGLIARIAHGRAGTRFLSRGVDDEGNTSNFVESEQVLVLWQPQPQPQPAAAAAPAGNRLHVLAFLQVRGSVPLHWEQAATGSVLSGIGSHRILFSRGAEQPPEPAVGQAAGGHLAPGVAAADPVPLMVPSLLRHFWLLDSNYASTGPRQLSTTRASCVQVVTLMNIQKAGERTLTEAYQRALKHMPYQVPFFHYDLHNETRAFSGAGGDAAGNHASPSDAQSSAGLALRKLVARLGDTIPDMGMLHTVNAMPVPRRAASPGTPPADTPPGPGAGAEVRARQQGIFRVNCVDCLDRTNAAQRAIGTHALRAYLGTAFAEVFGSLVAGDAGGLGYSPSTPNLVLPASGGLARTSSADGLAGPDPSPSMPNLRLGPGRDDTHADAPATDPRLATAYWSTIDTLLSNLWYVAGDQISKSYAGTGALRSSVTKTGKQTFSGLLDDVIKNVGRYVNNQFLDDSRQTATDFLLGRWISAVRSYACSLGLRLLRFRERHSFHIVCGSWNVNGRPFNPSIALDHWVQMPQFFDVIPDIAAFSFQEIVPLSARQIASTDPQTRKVWELALGSALTRLVRQHPGAANSPANAVEYHLLCSEQLVGACLVIFVRPHILPLIRNVERASTGLSGMAGNKGGVGVRFDLAGAVASPGRGAASLASPHPTAPAAGVSLLFIGAHLAAGQSKTADRDADYQVIAGNLRFAALPGLDAVHRPGNEAPPPACGYRDHRHIFWLGDLNYRIAHFSNGFIRQAVAEGRFDALARYDQLRQSQGQGRAFVGVLEGPLRFPPTYRYDIGTRQYDTSEKNRSPAWTDRILWEPSTGLAGAPVAGAPDAPAAPEEAVLLGYDHVDRLLQSDHRPIHALFRLNVGLLADTYAAAIQEMNAVLAAGSDTGAGPDAAALHQCLLESRFQLSEADALLAERYRGPASASASPMPRPAAVSSSGRRSVAPEPPGPRSASSSAASSAYGSPAAGMLTRPGPVPTASPAPAPAPAPGPAVGQLLDLDQTSTPGPGPGPAASGLLDLFGFAASPGPAASPPVGAVRRDEDEDDEDVDEAAYADASHAGHQAPEEEDEEDEDYTDASSMSTTGSGTHPFLASSGSSVYSADSVDMALAMAPVPGAAAGMDGSPAGPAGHLLLDLDQGWHTGSMPAATPPGVFDIADLILGGGPASPHGPGDLSPADGPEDDPFLFPNGAPPPLRSPSPGRFLPPGAPPAGPHTLSQRELDTIFGTSPAPAAGSGMVLPTPPTRPAPPIPPGGGSRGPPPPLPRGPAPAAPPAGLVASAGPRRPPPPAPPTKPPGT